MFNLKAFNVANLSTSPILKGRLLLDSIFRSTLSEPNVYFQPPNNLRMSYPCIIYKVETIINNYANNKLYRTKKKYKVTIIDRDPDSEIPNRLLITLPFSDFVTTFTKDNLNHTILNIYY